MNHIKITGDLAKEIAIKYGMPDDLKISLGDEKLTGRVKIFREKTKSAPPEMIIRINE